MIPYLKGVASSGKSTIVMRVCRGLYEPADVGVMSNNIERKFGLSALADKLLFVGPEIKGDCQIEQVMVCSLAALAPNHQGERPREMDATPTTP